VSAARVIPGLGGGGTKCASCAKTVYPADPSFAADGSTWHRECFKCTKCRGALTIKNMAAINGALYCKVHFVEIFKRTWAAWRAVGRAGAGGIIDVVCTHHPSPTHTCAVRGSYDTFASGGGTPVAGGDSTPSAAAIATA